MKWAVEYWMNGEWWHIASFANKEDAKEYVKYEEMRDRYMTRVNGIDHTVEYRIVERMV